MVKLDLVKIPNEVIERLLEKINEVDSFDYDCDVDNIQTVLAGMLDLDILTPERLKNKVFDRIRSSTFFAIFIALNTLRHNIDKVKSWIETVIQSDYKNQTDYGDQTKGDILEEIVEALSLLADLKVTEYKELKDWIFTKVFGVVPKPGTLKVAHLNSDKIINMFDCRYDKVKIIDDVGFLENLEVLPSDITRKLSSSNVKALTKYLERNKHYLKFADSLGYKLDMQWSDIIVEQNILNILKKLPYKWKNSSRRFYTGQVTVDLKRNTFTFKRGLQFRKPTHSLLSDLPTLQNTLSRIFPRAEVEVDKNKYVFICFYKETFPLRKTNE